MIKRLIISILVAAIITALSIAFIQGFHPPIYGTPNWGDFACPAMPQVAPRTRGFPLNVMQYIGINCGYSSSIIVTHLIIDFLFWTVIIYVSVWMLDKYKRQKSH